jgi:hypothetical protein
MPSKMTPKKLAEARAAADTANTLNVLATKANGLGVSRADRDKAAAALERAVGSRKAERLKETALQRAGARRRGLGRLLG